MYMNNFTINTRASGKKWDDSYYQHYDVELVYRSSGRIKIGRFTRDRSAGMYEFYANSSVGFKMSTLSKVLAAMAELNEFINIQE